MQQSASFSASNAAACLMFVIVYLSHGRIWRLCFIAISKSAQLRASGIGIQESDELTDLQLARSSKEALGIRGIDVLLNFFLFVLQSRSLTPKSCILTSCSLSL